MVRRLLAFWMLLAIGASAHAEPKQLAPGVWLQKGNFAPGSQPDGNSVVFESSKRLVVVDTGRHESHTRALLDFAASRKKPIAAIVNTHWHLALIEGGDQLGPDEIVSRPGTRSIAGRRLELFVSNRAATEADLWLLDTKSGVLVAGDLITLPAPFLDTACPKGMLTALDRISDTRFQTVVPGHGRPMSREEFERYRSAFAALLSCAASETASAACGEKWIDGLGDQIAESQHEFARGLMSYYIENHLRGDPAQTARLCGS